MPQLPLGLSSKRRKTAWMPQVRVVNYLVEKDEANQFDGITHIQRAGLSPFSEVGEGPIRGLSRQAGTFNGDFVVVSGEELYRVDDIGGFALIGAVPGSFRTTFAATSSRAIIVSDTLAYSTNGTVVTAVVMPDSRPAGSVAQLNGYFIIPEYGSARFYWIEPGQTDPDGLSFATTESTPGDIVIVVRVGDELWFLKEEGAEVWVPTGDADLPFQRVPGRNYDKGCRNGDTAVRFDNTLVWVGNDGVVYRADNSPIRISDNALEEQIRKSDPASLRAWKFAVDGHELYCLTMDSGTYVYDISSQQISEFRSYGRTYWRAHVGDEGETFTVCGDAETGTLWRVDPEVSNDDGEPLERILTGGITVLRGPDRCDTLSLYITTGTATDPEYYPKVRVRWSDDLQTYTDWEDVDIGRQGQYGRPVQLTRLGAMYYPGRLFEFSISDDVVATITAASYNEPVG